MGKKVLYTFFIFIGFFVVIFMQNTIFSGVTIAGISSNILLIYLIFLIIYSKPLIYFSLGIIAGIFFDLEFSNIIGVSSISLIFTMILIMFLNTLIYERTRLTFLIKVIIATICYEFLRYGIYILMNNGIFEISQSIYIVFIEIILNGLIAMFFYPLINLTKYEMNEVFNENNILTRYF